MLNTHRFQRSAGRTGSGGFTLVELLVVIGIIAILAGVALGPITAGLKKAQQSGAVQQARSLALAEFQYANDNNNVYPYNSDLPTWVSSMVPTYISDMGMLVINGSAETKYSGATPSSMTVNNVSYDFAFGSTAGPSSAPGGYNSQTPDGCPVVLSCIGAKAADDGTQQKLSPALTASMPLGLAGVAVCYKNNSARFNKADTSTKISALTDSPVGYAWDTILGGG